MSPFELASAVERVQDHVYRAVVPVGWEQGRGAFGGLVLGILARAMIASEPDTTRSLRFLTGEICGPVVASECSIEVLVLRRGKNLTNLDARMFQGGEVIARASAGLSAPRATAGEVAQPTPPVPPPHRGVAARAVPPPFAPPFSLHYDYRPTGPLPFSGGAEAIVEGYIREREPPSRVDAATLIALLDSYWPAMFTTETRPRGAATVGFTAQLLCDPTTLDPNEPLFHRSTMPALRDGFFVEFRELWSGSTLVAMNQQTMALLS